MMQIPFGLKDGRMVDIYQVEKGIACDCQCPHCLSALIARKGEIKVHHFAHKSGAVCQNVYETSIHKMAKQILMNERYLQLPSLHITVKDKNKLGVEHTETEHVCEQQWVKFEEVKEEVMLGCIRADIVGYKNNHPLIIEIMVTHASGQNKKRYIRNQAWAAIEIKLTKLDYLADTKLLKENILDSITNKYWLSHPRVPRIKQLLSKKLKDTIQKVNKKYELEAEEIRRKGIEEHNELLRKQKKRVQDQEKHYAKLKRTPTRKVSSDQYSTRYFICDNCGHRFNIEQDVLNDIKGKLDCPRCKKAVNQHAP